MALSLCKRLATLSLSHSGLTCSRQYRNSPKLRLPGWFIRKERTLTKEYLTRDNEEFINEVVQDQMETKLAVSKARAVETPLNNEVIESGKWNPYIQRAGLIAKKIGIYPMWSKDGRLTLTTLLQIIDNQVIKYIPPEEWNPKVYKKREIDHPKTKKGCLLVGSETTDPTRITKGYYGLFKDTGVVPKKHICRFVISSEAAIPPGTNLYANHFRVGDYIDIRSKTIDRGFQGVMKRWGFRGMPATHGVTKTHRRPGNIGAGGEKARVWPGTKLPGHMGNKWRIFRGAQILRINPEYNVLWIKGKAIPGPTNCLCYLYDTVLPLRKPTQPPPFPTYVPTEEDSNEEVFDENYHNFSSPTIMFSDT